MTNYENAPQTKLLATSCAVCGRPLCDSVSVEAGIGPICREKHGYNVSDVCELSRKTANMLVHRIAISGPTPESIEDINALRVLGFAKLADRIAQRLPKATVTIETALGGYLVSTPYSADANSDWRRIRGRRWKADAKANFVPRTSKPALCALLKKFFAGSIVAGPKGVFAL